MKKTYTLELASIISNSNSSMNSENDDRIILCDSNEKEIVIKDSYDNQHYIIETNDSSKLLNILNSNRDIKYKELNYIYDGIYASFIDIDLKYKIKSIKTNIKNLS